MLSDIHIQLYYNIYPHVANTTKWNFRTKEKYFREHPPTVQDSQTPLNAGYTKKLGKKQAMKHEITSVLRGGGGRGRNKIC